MIGAGCCCCMSPSGSPVVGAAAVCGFVDWEGPCEDCVKDWGGGGGG